jgi:hypothetical protein
MKGEIFGKEFAQDAKKIFSLLPRDSEENILAYEYMEGILNQILQSEQNNEEIANLIIFLNEKDRRRGTNWRTVFPWLGRYEHVV